MKRQGTGREQASGTRDQVPRRRGTGRARVRKLVGPVVVLLAAGLAIVPLLVRGDSCGHDFDFHLVSWFDALHAWGQGIVYPHWAQSPNFNAGEPRFVFYPPLTWVLGAALGAVLPWTRVAPALAFLLLAGTGLTTRALARHALGEAAATLAGCIAIFSGYTLFTVYERSALAELAGGIWMPLIVLLMLRKSAAGGWRRALDGTALWLAVVVAAAWLSNAPVGVMSCYLLAGVALVVAVVDRSWIPVVRAAVGAALGLGLAAFYLVPAAAEQRWVDIRQAIDDPGEQIRNSFLFGHHADPRLALHDVELHRVSWIAVAMLATVLAAAVVCRMRRTLPGGRRWWLALAVIPATVLVLLLPVSLPVWQALPKMQFLQFPWRWLVAVEAPLGIFVAAAVSRPATETREQVAGMPAGGGPAGLGWAAVLVSCAVFSGLTWMAGRVFFQVCDQYDAVPGMIAVYRDQHGFEGTDEYAPVATDNTLVAQDLSAACLVQDPTQTLGVATPDDPQPDWAPNQKSCVATLDGGYAAGGRAWSAEGMVPQAGFLVLDLRRYPAWRVKVNGRVVSDQGEREDGLMVVPAPAGPVEVAAEWITTRDVLWGRGITLAALALVAGAWLAAERKRKLSLE